VALHELSTSEFEHRWTATAREYAATCRIPEARFGLTHYVVHGLSRAPDLLANGGTASFLDEGIWNSDIERETFDAVWEPHFGRRTHEHECLSLSFSSDELPVARPLIAIAAMSGWLVRLLSPDSLRSIEIDHDSHITFAVAKETMLAEFDWVVKTAEEWRAKARSGFEW